jgi:hypothetical protein
MMMTRGEWRRADGLWLALGLVLIASCGEDFDVCATPRASDFPFCPPRGCDYEGQHYDVGEQFKDDCNDCTCQPDGTVPCTLKLCVDGGPEDASCGGLLGVLCGEGQYCNYAPEASCGAADAPGTCTDIPEVCNRIYAPVCGCDGQTYGNACEASSRSVSIASEGECADAGTGPGCRFGATEFPPGTTIICPDGCNQCSCRGDDSWISTKIGCEPVRAEACDPSMRPEQNLNVDALYLAGDALALSVQLGGGCVEHSFKLCYSEAFKESSPVQADLWLVDRATEPDPCDALLTRELAFDLSALREHYGATYPNGPSQMLLNVSREQLDYDFD